MLEEPEAYAEASPGWGTDFNGDFLYAVEPDDVYDGPPTRFFLGLEAGECTAAYEADDPESEDHGFVFRAPYANWKKLFDGELGPVDGLTSGEFDVDGDVQEVLQYSDAAVVMTETGRDIDTEFDSQGASASTGRTRPSWGTSTRSR